MSFDLHGQRGLVGETCCLYLYDIDYLGHGCSQMTYLEAGCCICMISLTAELTACRWVENASSIRGINKSICFLSFVLDLFIFWGSKILSKL